MIAVWMLYATAMASMFAMAGVLGEWVLANIGKPRRFAWLAALNGCALLLATAVFTGGGASNIRNIPAVPVFRIATALPNLNSSPTVGGRTIVSRAASNLPSLDLPLLVIWIAASLFLLIVFTTSYSQLVLRRRQWRHSLINGVPVHISHDVGPAVFGWLRYSIVIPAWVSQLSIEEQKLVVLHEQEHARSADPAGILIGFLLVALVPWNLPFYFMLQRLRLAIELDCDGRVLAVTSGRQMYANLLIGVSERTLGSNASLAALLESSSALAKRIDAITKSSTPRPQWQTSAAAIVGCVLLVAACQTPRPRSSRSRADLIAELVSSLQTDSTIRHLPDTERANLRRALSTALSATDVSFHISQAQMDGLALKYYPELASRPGNRVLVAFVFDSADKIVMNSKTVALDDERIPVDQQLRSLFPGLGASKLYKTGIYRTQLGGAGPSALFIWGSLRRPEAPPRGS